MGSKRSSSKNPNKDPSPPLPPPTEAPADGTNPKKRSVASPSKPLKKTKPLVSMSGNPDVACPVASPEGEDLSRKSGLKRKAGQPPKEISSSPSAASAGEGAPPVHSASARWGDEHTLKLLRAAISFKLRNGLVPKLCHMSHFLKEIEDWVPGPLSEKNVVNKLRNLKVKFQKSPKPGPESLEFSRSFYELASKLWDSDKLKGKGSDGGAAMDRNRAESNGDGMTNKDKSSNKSKKKAVSSDLDEEDGEDEDGVGNDEDEDNGRENKMKKQHVDGGNGLLNGNVSGCQYKFLRSALEEFWLDKKLDLDILNTAFKKVNPVQAKQLDEQFKELWRSS
ncbi:hypothetical protein HPP92_005489 [Vanilla planifolia]|uniref:Glabrous enhancer-binding protein-like DBD domain-containing protein n=1 Tax=Vanilla planifolia TaxID=51239 RepID=A0A835RLG6_VANPL|nr:hypothetical protein HPP92_005489 [Vanilla planifolia]